MRRLALSLAAAGGLLGTVVFGQQPVLKLTARSANVNEPGNNVRIEILRWSTDQERNQLVAALTPPAPAPAGVFSRKIGVSSCFGLSKTDYRSRLRQGLAGTARKSVASPSAIVGWARIASRNAV